MDTCGYMQWRREGGGQGGGAIALGPGPVVGARAKLDFFCALIGSQWGIQGGGGPGGVLVNVQEGGCFSNSRRADDVTQAMSKGGGGACECPRGGCFSISLRVDDVTRTMSKGGVLVNVQEGGCFSNSQRVDDVTRTMSKGGGGWCL